MTQEQSDLINSMMDAALHGTPINIKGADLYFANKFMDALAAGTVSFKQVSA